MHHRLNDAIFYIKNQKHIFPAFKNMSLPKQSAPGIAENPGY